MLSIDNLREDARTFQGMIDNKRQELAEANATLFRMEGALNYITRCIEFLDHQEIEEDSGLSETL